MVSNMRKFIITLLSFINAILINNVSGSMGDRSQFYRQCILECYSIMCQHNAEFEVRVSPIDNSLMTWSCEDECGYTCMWNTVDHFVQHGYQVPQFHGKQLNAVPNSESCQFMINHTNLYEKYFRYRIYEAFIVVHQWPFLRILGIQEPASVLFSLFNFYGHAYMYRKFRNETRADSPMSLLWTYFTVVCLNGWFWSAIFHARDRPFTEMMDYSCAFAMVITLWYCMLMRITYKSKKAFVVITCAYISILFTHLSHLWSGKINYGYNMKMNIFFGFLTFLITMIWWYMNSKKLKHAYLMGWFNILTVSVTLLEVADFPPYYWIFDAHALWHASTAPLTILLYRFMILDCQYLRKASNQVTLDHHQLYD